MNSYISIFKISLAQEFAYRINFVMWRLRNIIQFILLFFLWDTVFLDPGRVVFGYNKSSILTYIFGILLIRAFVFSSRAVDVAGEIAQGNLSNYLVKPINYFYYWFTRDLSSKALNLIFAAGEFTVLFLIFKPDFFLQSNPFYLISFGVSIALAIILFYIILLLASSVPFWTPELAWGAQFLVINIITEFLSGALFPLDILSPSLQSALSLTPFPYLMFFPLEVYLGKIAPLIVIKGIAISAVWIALLWLVLQKIWQKGLLVYEGYGR